MERGRLILSLVLCALLGGAATILGARLVDRLGWVLEPGGVRLATTTAATRERLARFPEHLTLSYYVTPREALPSHLAHLEEDVRAGLEALASAADGTCVVEVVHPEAFPQDRAALASAGLAPWRARGVAEGGFREETLWSSLRIAYGAAPAIVLNGLGPGEARRVQELVLAHLEELVAPTRPRIALSAPTGFERLRGILRTGAEVLEVDFDGEGELPDDVDVLFWLGGVRADARHLASLDALHARGGAAVISLESLELSERWEAIGPRVRVRRDEARAEGARRLAAHLGLVLAEGLLLDPRGAELAGPEGRAVVVPWRVRATPDHQDFRGLAEAPGAPLYFAAPTPLAPHAARLAERGRTARVLATSSDAAVVAPLPEIELDLASAAALEGTPAPRAGLAVELASSSPWLASDFVLADASPLADADFDGDVFGHGAFLRVLLEATCSPSRRARARIAALEPAPLGPRSPAERALWRLFVLGAAPAALLLALFLRRGRGERRGRDLPRGLGLALVAGAVLVALLAHLTPRVELDATRDGRNRMTRAEREVLRGLVSGLEDEVVLASCFSDADALPPELVPLAREARRAAREFAAALDGVTYRRLVPEVLGDEALSGEGLAPREFSSSLGESPRTWRAYASLVISCGERREVLDFPDTRSFLELRFRLAFALDRLAREDEVRVALIAETPRLSPAEAAIEFQQRGLFAPREADAYGELTRLLEGHDFRVRRVDARSPALDEDTDVVLLLQPRRDASPALEALSEHLARGGGALVAAQHFAVQARQLEGRDLALAFWPRPLFCDLDSLYLPQLGAALVREVLLDTPPGSLDVRTRVDAEGGPRYEVQPSTQPFFVNATPDASALPLFEGLGELLLPFPARFELDEARLAELGLTARTWLRASPRAWSFDWQGGDLAPEVLAGAGTPTPESALGVLIEGILPRARRIEGQEGAQSLTLEPGEEPGRLFALGDGELFSDRLLTLEGRAHEAFALRCVAGLGLAPEVASFLRRERAPEGLPALSPGERRGWRLLVLGAAPLFLILAALLRRAVS